MVKYKLILLLILAIKTQFSLAQHFDSLLSFCQDSSKVIEKVYLHTDRDYYSPGDDIWFKAYLVKASDMVLSSHSRNLHVELISPEAKIIDNHIVRMEEGLGNGDFRLSDSLRSGSYLIRAYTNYMRNFNDSQFFKKEIIVISSPDTSEMISDSAEYVIE